LRVLRSGSILVLSSFVHITPAFPLPTLLCPRVHRSNLPLPANPVVARTASALLSLELEGPAAELAYLSTLKSLLAEKVAVRYAEPRGFPPSPPVYLVQSSQRELTTDAEGLKSQYFRKGWEG
jgi:hypothetical protein